MRFPLTCPICRKSLTWNEKTVTCTNRHAFDIAREGYVNIYQTSRKAENQPGDSREMLQARRAFLNTGWYEPLSDRLNDLATHSLKAAHSEVAYILDVGCGEGYYLSRMMKHLDEVCEGQKQIGCGIDISKAAIRMAARQYDEHTWCVANAADQIPCQMGSVHLAFSVFAPRFSEVLRQVLAPEGQLLIALPGPDHLQELNSLAMAQKRDTDSKEADTMAQYGPHFRLVDRQSVTFNMSLEQDPLWDLYRMIPVYWRSTREAQARIRALERLEVTADFVLLAFKPGQPSVHPV